MVLIDRLSVFCMGLLLVACASAPEQKVIPAQPAVDTTATSPPDTSANAAPPQPVGEPTQSSAVEGVLDRAAAALSVQQWKQASRYLDQAQRMAPRLPRVYLLYGDYYFELAKWDQARAMYQRCLSLSENGSYWALQARLRLDNLP
ncbi:MAG: hypothetical protein R3183_01655 [Oleiphilaceae bacterium]|nr:hypothetical protein [Oleiphilaceae bacterium]